MKAENDFSLILRTFAEAKIDFIVVGAIAVIAQGIILTTDDVDVVYSRAPENLTRIVAALTPSNLTCAGLLRDCPSIWMNALCAMA